MDKDGPSILSQLEKALPGRALAKRTASKWLADFRGGRTATFDKNRYGRPRSARVDHNIAMIKIFLEESRSWSACELAVRVNVCHRTVLKILHEDLGMVKKRKMGTPYFKSRADANEGRHR